MARYGLHKEQRYRQQFEKPFNFSAFNKELTLCHGSGRYAIAFDPTYISKSGKKTPGVGWYAGVISDRKDTLTGISKYLVADTWFSKRPFTDQIISLEIYLISRLRDDADLKYLCKDSHTGKKGRPHKYDGKIIIKDIINWYKLSNCLN